MARPARCADLETPCIRRIRQTQLSCARALWAPASRKHTHHSFPQGAHKATWLKRYAAFAVSSGVPAPDAERAIRAIDEQLPTLSPERDTALLEEAGFSDVELFYAGFSFRGWVATA